RRVADRRALDMAERLDADIIADANAGAEEDAGLDHHVAAEFGIMAEPHLLGIDQRRAVPHRAGAPAHLRNLLGLGKLGAVVDAEKFRLRPAHESAGEAAANRKADEIGEIIFALRIAVVDGGNQAFQMRAADRHNAGITKPYR